MNTRIKLASTMVSGLENVNHYVDVNPEAAPEPSKGSTSGSVDQLARRVKELNKPDDLMKKSVLKPGFEKLEAVPRYDEGRRRLKLQRRKEVFLFLILYNFESDFLSFASYKLIC